MAGEIQLNATSFASESSGTITVNNGTISSAVVFPAGHIIQVVPPLISVETNTLTTSYVNYYEAPITLKSSSSNVLILHQTNYFSVNGGIGQKIYRSNSTPVTDSDTVVFDKVPADSSGPMAYFGGTSGGVSGTGEIHAMDIISGTSAGTTLYYGFFYKARSTGSNYAEVPSGESVQNGHFSTVLIEIQK